jgi:hypothetical protein
MDDSEYIDEENDVNEKFASNNNKSSTSKPKSKGGRPKGKDKHQFTAEDKEILVEAVKKYGSSYATIAKEYFGHCEPPVTRTDIHNIVQATPHLKNHCLTGRNFFIYSFF